MRLTPTVRAPLGAIGLTLLLGALAGAGESDELENLARELVTRRTEVERLSSEVELKKTQLREELRASAQQQSDLQRQAKALEQELEQLRTQTGSQAAAVESRQAARAALGPVVVRHLQALEEQVQGGLPFRALERQQELARLRADVLAGKVGSPEALGRLWSSYEDELRLCRESGLYRQQIEVDGQAQLADVVRLGMVLLYFRTLDGRYGMAVPGGPEQPWRWRVLEDRASHTGIAALFEAQEKHIRQGLFLLPNPWPSAAPAADGSSR